ncbi:MAG: winged helix DNA-binding domain-containing protein [Candidatus Hodarchaeota archaeon]
MSIVSIQDLRLNQLQKQYLLDNNEISFYDIAKDHLGLHSTDYWTPYLSVFARIGDYNPEKIFQSLNRGDKLARINAFRRTLFVVHTDNLAMVFQATGSRFYDELIKSPYLKDFTNEEIDHAIENIIATLESSPMTTRELKQKLPKLAPNMRGFLLGAMARGNIIRATAKHARSNLTTYAPVSKWVSFDLNRISYEQALNQLIFSYIKVFGPVSEADVAWWLGLSRKEVKGKLQEIEKEILSFKIKNFIYYMDRTDYEAALSLDPLTDPVINFLPYEDHFPKAYIDRSWFISEKNRPKLFPRNKKSYWPTKPTQVLEPTSRGVIQSGELRPSIWLNEKIIGRWELEKNKKEFTIIMSLYQDVDSSLKDSITEKRDQLERFINERLMPIS